MQEDDTVDKPQPARPPRWMTWGLSLLTAGVLFWAVHSAVRHMHDQGITPPPRDDMTFTGVQQQYGDGYTPLDHTPLPWQMPRTAHPADEALEHEPADLPVYPGATARTALQRAAHGRVEQIAWWVVPEAALPEVAAFYRDHARERGFRRINPQPTDQEDTNMMYMRRIDQPQPVTQWLTIHLLADAPQGVRVMVQLSYPMRAQR